MIIKTKELFNTLSLLKSGLGKGEDIEGSNCFVFHNQHIYSYNDRICIISPFFLSNLHIGVASDEFYKTLVRITDPETHLIVSKDKTKLTLRAFKDKIKATFNTIKIDDLLEEIPVNIGDKNLWYPLPKNFIEAIRLCYPTASDNATLSDICFLEILKDKITSCDDAQISEYTMDEKIDQPFLLPKESAKELSFIDNVISYCIIDSWVCFKTSDDRIFCSRLSYNEYPDYTDYFVFDIVVSFPTPEKLSNAVEVASTFTLREQDVDRKIKVTLEDNSIMLESSNVSGNIIKEFYNKTKVKKKTSFHINPEFFKRALNESTKVAVGTDRILFSSDSYKLLVGLMQETEL